MLNKATKDFIKKHLFEDVRKLALQIKQPEASGIDISLALNQIEARRKSESKIPSWYKNEDILYPSLISVEQCSSENTAQYKASLISGDTLVDLTGGFGVDAAFLSEKFDRVVYVERQKELANIAFHNFRVLNLPHIEVVNTDSIQYLNQMSLADCIFIDPSRRSSTGSRVLLIQDCEPNLIEIQDRLQAKATAILVKLSPMLDVKSVLKEIKNVEQIHIISVNNECKELVLLIKSNYNEEPLVRCVNIRREGNQINTFKCKYENDISISYTVQLQQYLYEPNASIMKGGFYKSIAVEYHLEKLHINSHLYTSSQLVTDFPGRIFEVADSSSMNKKDLKIFLSEVKQANLSIRNFPMPVSELQKKLRIKDGGELYLFGTTLANDKRIMIKTRQIFIS